ncbi:MAG: YkgJ family cysteine cluster protein [Candidatus Binatia bacterium]
MEENGCRCDICQGFCRTKPGWFKPGEAEKVAEFLKLDLERLFDGYLLVDYWLRRKSDILVLSPGIKESLPGRRFPLNPRGECVFFKNGLCKIHPVKPYECRVAHHASSDQSAHEKVAKSWDNKKRQRQAKTLLRRTKTSPYVRAVSDFEALRDLLGMGTVQVLSTRRNT